MGSTVHTICPENSPVPPPPGQGAKYWYSTATFGAIRDYGDLSQGDIYFVVILQNALSNDRSIIAGWHKEFS